VRLEDGGGHEDIGYGKIENTKSKGDGLDKVRFFLLFPHTPSY
jgi:DNA repair and recombination protein RAD52